MKRRRKTSRRENRPFFSSFDSPFKDFSPEEIEKLREKVGQDAAQNYTDGINRLVEIFRSYNPISIISILATYGPVAYVTSDDQLRGHDQDGSGITQAHIEFALGVFIGNVTDPDFISVVPDEIIGEVWELLPALFRHCSLIGIGEGAGLTGEEKTLREVQQWMRMHTLSVRNWGTHEQVKRICRDLYSPLDFEIEEELGFRAVDAINVFEAMVRLTESRMNLLQDRMRPAFRSKTIRELANRFTREFDETFGTADGFVAFLESRDLNFQDAKKACIAFLNSRVIQEHYIFSANDVGMECQLPIETVRTVFESFSIQKSDVMDFELSSLQLNNPVWEKPLVPIGEDSVFSPGSLRFFHDPKKLIESRVRSQRLRTRICDRRAKFLEEQVGTLFRKYFPTAIVSAKVEFKHDGQKYETDLLVQVDTCLFVVEAKSGAVSLPALRGAPDRIRREVKKLIEVPSVQSQRFASLLLDSIRSGIPIEFVNDVSGFDLGSVIRIVRLSVTLDDFATLQSQISKLSRAGTLDSRVRIAPTMILADLEMVFDILEDPALRIHYLFRRGELPGDLLMMAHEAEWLQFYLNTGFNVGDLEDNEEGLMFPFGSEFIDNHYHLIESVGVNSRKPRPQISKYWIAILKRLRTRNFKGWTETACVLLGCSLEEQDMIEIELRKLKKTVPKSYRDPNHNNSVVCVPRKARHDAIAFMVLVEDNYGSRRELFENLSDKVFENDHVQRCLILGRKISNWSAPYEVLGLLYREGGNSIQSF